MLIHRDTLLSRRGMLPSTLRCSCSRFDFICSQYKGEQYSQICTHKAACRREAFSHISCLGYHFQPWPLMMSALIGFQTVNDSSAPIILYFGLFSPKLITLHLLTLNEAHMPICHFHAHLPGLRGAFWNAIPVTSAFPHSLELTVRECGDFTFYGLIKFICFNSVSNTGFGAHMLGFELD